MRPLFKGSVFNLAIFTVLAAILLLAVPLARGAPLAVGGENLLINPNFDQPDPSRGGFFGWTRVRNIWVISHKPSNPSPNNTSAKLGQDIAGGDVLGWPTGSEDWLRQDVHTTQPHTSVVLEMTEIQHMRTGVAEARLYGSNDGVTWQQIWYRSAPAAPLAILPTDWYTFTYKIPSSHAYYRLEFHGILKDPNDGWKFTLLDLHVIVDPTATPIATPTGELRERATPTPTPRVR